jgi:hypothetical protein
MLWKTLASEMAGFRIWTVIRTTSLISEKTIHLNIKKTGKETNGREILIHLARFGK